MLGFEQTKVIKLADIAFTSAPIIAFVTAWAQLYYLGWSSLNTALAMSLLILSLPFHAFFLLGLQAAKKLPLGLQSWYREIEHQLKQQQLQFGESLEIGQSKSNGKLDYMDLAKLLKILFEDKR